jgi:signal transduction histidine kinase
MPSDSGCSVERVNDGDPTAASLALALDRERTARRICAELNNFVDLQPALKSIVGWITKLSGCGAVAIRLHDGGDYPYFVHDGFSKKFILKENSLCSRDASGRRIPAPDGAGYVLDCMCGNIICGRFDPSLPFFTANGSFWSNGTTGLLASTTEEDRQSRTRNYCNSRGYESVALVPIKVRGDRIGLLQLNDRRPGMFTAELIAFMEMIGEQIGLAVRNSYSYLQLKDLKDDLERSNRDLQQFASVASHDLQEPLRMISSFLTLLARKYEGQLDEEADTFISYAVNGAQRLQALIRDLLEYSRVGTSAAQPVPTDCSAILDDVISDLRVAIADCRGRVSYDPLPTVPVIPSQVFRLFENLLQNAIRYRGDAPPRVHVSARKEGGEWIFSVRDNGVGLDMKHAGRIFELFKRLTPRDGDPGTGLGLAICKKMVESHGGRIWVESEPGVGSTFYFALQHSPSRVIGA